MTQTSSIRIENQGELTSDSSDRDRIQKILGNVVHDKAFFFYEDIGKPTGEFAVNLSDFCNKIITTPAQSLSFHLNRGDFENWIRDIVGDAELSRRISKLKTNKKPRKGSKTLNKKLQTTVKGRIDELRDEWHDSLKWPPH